MSKHAEKHDEQCCEIAAGLNLESSVVSDGVPGATAFEDGLEHSFVLAIVTAWCRHLPLVLKPDHIMLLILQAIARHVNSQPEKMRSKIVRHEKVKRIKVRCPCEATRDLMMEKLVCGFTAKVHKYATSVAFSAFTEPFSTSSSDDLLAACITLMDATQHYFSFGFAPFCGFPTITLAGDSLDWQMLRIRAERAIRDLTC